MRLILLFLLLSFGCFAQDKLVVYSDSMPVYGDSMLIIDKIDADALAFQRRVVADGGTVINLNYVDSCIKFYKQFKVWDDIISDYDANYAVKWTVSGNDSLVDKLYDLKGRYDMRGTTTTRPDLQKNVKNGKYSIYFDTTGSAGAEINYLVSTTTSLMNYVQPLTFIALYKLPPSMNNTTQRFVYGGNYPSTYLPRLTKNTTVKQMYNSANTIVAYNQTIGNIWQLNTFVYQGTTSKRLLDGGSITTGLSANTVGLVNNIALGTNIPYNNYITKLTILSGDHATTAQWIHKYLNERFNIY